MKEDALSDRDHLDRGDIWSNKTGWRSRGETARDMAREMLPLYRALWVHHMKTDISDDDLLDTIVNAGLSPAHMVFGG